jgi:Zn-dependent metalloprotease
MTQRFPQARRTRRLAAVAFALAVAILSVGASQSTSGTNARAYLPQAHFDVRNLAPVSVRETATQRRLVAHLGARMQFNAHNGIPFVLMKDRATLTRASHRRPEAIARAFLRKYGALYHLSARDVAQLVSAQYVTKHNGATQLTFHQPSVFGSGLKVTVDRRGRVVIVTGTLFPEAQTKPAAPPQLAADAAVVAAAHALGINASGPLQVLPSIGGIARFKNTLAQGDNRPYDITAQRVTFPIGAGEPARSAWSISLETSPWADYTLVVDAQTGDLLYKDNGIADADGTVVTVQNPAATGGTTLTDVTFPAGWVSGRTTSGQNVNAYQDLTESNSVEYQPQTPDTPDPNYQRFNYAFSNDWALNGPHSLQPAGPTGYKDIDFVLTQLFYYNNVMHDFLLGFGFNAAAGNFEGSDPVLAEATDGYDDGVAKHCSGPSRCVNNANFNTQADGTSSRMQMYMFENPQRDGAIDGDVIAHEYGHGLSGRLIANGNLGSTVQTGALGEGWSDIVSATKWDDPVIGEYVTGNATTGIRNYSMANSPLKYSSLCTIGGGCEVHNDGEIWTAAFWDMRTKLVARYGDPAGKTFAFQLIVDGMKNTAPNPTFLSARDGILAADQTDKGGADTCLIWGAYAGREMGFSASTTGNADTTPTVATDGPASCTPVANIGGPYTTNEGSPIALNATATTENGDGPFTYSWDLNNDGTYGDAFGKTPTFGSVGQDGTYTVGLKVTNADGFSSTASTSVTVNNVVPTVTTLTTSSPQPEDSAVSASIVVTDPGWLDTPTATINWGDGSGTTALAGVLAAGSPPAATLTSSPTHTYGDNGSFTLTICPSDEAPGPCSTATIVVTNVRPTAAIDKSGATIVNGVATFIGHSGTPMSFSGSSVDPGSDDLTLVWNYDDGTILSTPYLNDAVNFPGGDPFPSPSIDPRSVTDTHSHTFGDACVYNVTFRSTDDDAGSNADNVAVIMAGNSGVPQGAGYWQTQYRPRPTAFTEAKRQCYLKIAAFMSQVFNEVTDASTVAKAFDVLNVANNGGSATQQLDRQLLTSWLNFANGGFEFGQLVDTNADGVPDTPFSAVLANAESVRLNPASTADQLRAQKNLLERING